ncbi:MAG: hypothetical protein ACM36C_14685 [Acidobacteriota bacterium]
MRGRVIEVGLLAGEFEPLPLSDLMAYLRELEKPGQVKLTAAAPAR